MKLLQRILLSKWLKRILLSFIVGVIAYFVLFMYLLMDIDHMDEAYKKYCDHHIELLEKYYQDHNTYPQSLSILDRKDADPKYIDENCGYRHAKDSFTFSIQNGFGVAGYESWKKKWWFD